MVLAATTTPMCDVKRRVTLAVALSYYSVLEDFIRDLTSAPTITIVAI